MEENSTLTVPTWFVFSHISNPVLTLSLFQRGNPLGGLMYSNAYPKLGADNNTYLQVLDWNQ